MLTAQYKGKATIILGEQLWWGTQYGCRGDGLRHSCKGGGGGGTCCLKSLYFQFTFGRTGSFVFLLLSCGPTQRCQGMGALHP